MSIQTQAPPVTILAPGIPAPSVTLMWAETPFSVLLASSGYTSTAPPSLVLTFAQSAQLALQWVGVAQRAGPPTQTNSLVTTPASPPPPPSGFPHYHLAFINRVLLRAPHVTLTPCALIR